jgi:hypothetical protein
VADGITLAGNAAAGDLNHGIVLADALGCHQRSHYGLAVVKAGKTLIVGGTINYDSAISGKQPHLSYRRLSLAGSVIIDFLFQNTVSSF